MKFLRCESFFTHNPNELRIFIDKTLCKNRSFEHNNIAIYLNRYSEKCKTFKRIQVKVNVYNFYFYSQSNHKELCG
ncbi:unnamed protein product [Nezara viridula]|uniref:Uncharacterized protein n=1 Tax=Nezara viridula TaxID=85310 RepID=A0A9P0MTE9_NEZVI|nr:unnamed protein product [Nezara viridula]